MKLLHRSLVFSICFVMFLALLLFALSGLAGASRAPSEYGSNWERTCEGDECTLITYPYEKYWETSEGQWEEINEGFFECSEENRIQYCTNEYYFSVRLDDEGRVSFLRNGHESSIRFVANELTETRFTPQLLENELIYRDVQPGIDIKYQYLAHKLKEEIILNEPPVLENRESLDFSFAHERTGSDLIMEPSYICDSNHNCLYLESSNEEQSMSVSVPRSYFEQEGLVYPLVIDPTVIFNSTYVRWNGVIDYSDDTYMRYNNPSWLYIGEDSSKGYRSAIEFDSSNIPSTSVVTELTVMLATQSIHPQYNFSLYPLKALSTDYPNETGDCDGNCEFYDDMGDGDEPYASVEAYGDGGINIKLSATAEVDFAASVIDKFWGFGIKSTDFDLGSDIYARDNPDTGKRPYLIVRYGVNNNDGNKWIEKGINNSLPLNPVAGDQQIYVVNQAGQHYLGRFDRVTMFGNQTWAFNYLVFEAPVTMPSLFRVLNIWQNSSLSSSQIISQVENFINATRY